MRALLTSSPNGSAMPRTAAAIPAVGTLAVVAESANGVPRAKVQLGAG